MLILRAFVTDVRSQPAVTIDMQVWSSVFLFIMETHTCCVYSTISCTMYSV